MHFFHMWVKKYQLVSINLIAFNAITWPGSLSYLAAAAADERQVLKVRDRYVIGLPSPSPDTGGREEEDKNVLALQASSQVELNCILDLSQSCSNGDSSTQLNWLELN